MNKPTPCLCGDKETWHEACYAKHESERKAVNEHKQMGAGKNSNIGKDRICRRKPEIYGNTKNYKMG